MAHPYWPMFDLEARTPRVTLRYIDDALGSELVDIMHRGIHDPSFMPFATAFTDVPPDQLGPESFRYWWRSRAETTVDSWSINLAVIEDGAVVGATGLLARTFPVLRTFETGSWLGMEHQGRGLGTELRIATLHLGFVAFDARQATTGAFFDNPSSLGVTRKLGYEPNGSTLHERRGESAETIGFVMHREHFEQNVRRDDIEIVGDDAVRGLLGISR